MLGAEPERVPDGTFIDRSVPDDCDVVERDAIHREERRSAA
jgi:hypothetical protein